MMKMKAIPVATARKALSVWTGKDFLYTENFPELLHEISSVQKEIPSLYGDDYFLVSEDNIPFPLIHGMFRNWDALRSLVTTIGHTFHIITRFSPAPDQASDIDPNLLFIWTGSPENKNPAAKGDITLAEAEAFIRRESPELFNRLYCSLIEDSLNEKLFTVIRDQDGKITFLHLVRKFEQSHDGVYLWSSLPFGESVREYKNSIARLAIGRLTSIILKSNERSLAFHNLLGFQFNGIHSYRIRYDYP